MTEPSDWVRRFAPLIPAGGRVLDLACGSGRNLRWLAEQGYQVTGVDRDAAAVAPLGELARIVVADIEAGPWPLNERFEGVIVTNYLWRPLMAQIRDCLVDGGILIYETFAQGQQTVGRPSRPDFLLQPGELLRVFADLRIVAFEDGFVEPPARFVQRMAAVLAATGTEPPPRYRLDAAG